MNYIAKINISRVMLLFCFPIWLWQEALCVDRQYASRRISLLRSLMKIKVRCSKISLVFDMEETTKLKFLMIILRKLYNKDKEKLIDMACVDFSKYWMLCHTKLRYKNLNAHSCIKILITIACIRSFLLWVTIVQLSSGASTGSSGFNFSFFDLCEPNSRRSLWGLCRVYLRIKTVCLLPSLRA